MFRNEEGDAKIEHVAEAFKLEGMINSNAADVVLYSLREKFQGTDRLIVPRWVTTKILIGDTAGNVRQWFLKSVSDGIDFLHFPTFDPPLEDLDMKSGEAVGHWCLVVLNLKFRCFECLDSLRDETWESAVSFFRTMTDNTKRLWRECNIDRLRLLTPARIDDFSAEFVRVSLQQNTHDCGFFMLQNCKSYHCRDDGVIELLDYTHVDIPAIRKTLLYTCATSELFNVDFRGLFGIEPCEWLDLGENDYRIFGSQFLELERVPVDLGLGRSPQKTRSGVQKGRLGDLKGSAAADAKTPVTPKDHIVQLIDSEESDDAFEKIPVVRRVTRSAAVKGVSPLAGVVHRRAGVARKDAALESGNVTSTKHAPRAPLKFSSPVQELHPYKFPHLDKARRLYDIMFRDEARKMYAGNCFALIPQPDGSVTDFTGKRIWEVFAPGQLMEGDVMMPLFKPIVLAKDKTVPHYSLYVMNRYRNTIDILDSLPYQKKRGASSKSMYHKHCELIFTRLVQVLKAVYGQAQYNASKQPNRAAIAKRPRYVALPLQGENECGNYAMKYAATYDGEKLVEDIQDQDPRVVDWKSQDLYTIVFNPKNQVMVTELPAEIQPLAPNAD